MRTIKRWFGWIGALFAAVLAVLYAIRSRQHDRRREKLEHEAEVLQNDITTSVAQAAKARKKAKAARLRADAAHEEAEAIADGIEEQDLVMAERIRRYNDRRARRMRDD